MKHVIIGTAGHVDHGKTRLVLALTGVDTDRLPEEKRRGLTIESGFARLAFPDGSSAGVVDVPGHEKFIANMLAGAGGIDLAMLVIAADEGVMPQTVEHLAILSLLGVRRGVIVLTKCDLADEAQRAHARAAARECVRGSFLEGAPLLETSIYDPASVEALRAALHACARETAEKNHRAAFRLPIDRVFSVDGSGTVVTGTLIEGTVRVGDEAELMPSGRRARVRGIQSHGESVPFAVAGQRAALNLAGVKRADIQRGEAAVKPESITPTRLLDVRLVCLANTARTIRGGSQLHFCHGTRVSLARVVLLGRDELRAGESCYAQLRFAEPLAVKAGDRFVVRFYSPLETVGGGTVLDAAPARHKKSDPAVPEQLAIRERGSDAARVRLALTELDAALPTAGDIARRLGAEEEETAAVLAALTARGEALAPLTGRYIAADAFDALAARCEALLAAYHEKDPLHAGMRAPELCQKLFAAPPRAETAALLAALEGEGRVRRVGERWALPAFEVRLTRRQTQLRARLLAAAPAKRFTLESAEDILSRVERQERTEARRVFESLTSAGEFVPVAQGVYLRRADFEVLLETVRGLFEGSGSFTLAQLRDALATSRDDALVLLEHLDRTHVTRRVGDRRVPDQLPPR